MQTLRRIARTFFDNSPERWHETWDGGCWQLRVPLSLVARIAAFPLLAYTIGWTIGMTGLCLEGFQRGFDGIIGGILGLVLDGMVAIWLSYHSFRLMWNRSYFRLSPTAFEFKNHPISTFDWLGLRHFHHVVHLPTDTIDRFISATKFTLGDLYNENRRDKPLYCVNVVTRDGKSIPVNGLALRRPSDVEWIAGRLNAALPIVRRSIAATGPS